MERYKTVDDYIDGSRLWGAELAKIRGILQSTELTEEVKWGAPCYTYGGKNVVGMAGFKSYFGLWFHQGALLKDDQEVLINAQEGKTQALRQWRMSSAKEIKPTVIKRYVREAIQLVRDGKSMATSKKKTISTPPELAAALKKSKVAQKKFAALTAGRQRDYAEYIASARRDETKQNRLRKIMPMIRQGIGLNDKYHS
jgi:uncharacterized protein YdeI (YjbR/CyaY-like superfamily)